MSPLINLLGLDEISKSEIIVNDKKFLGVPVTTL